ncbi:C2H2-type zinc finger protein [Sulfurisphaera tokodaii]|uniref:C2H2-type domain-containing protein n=2 Tax=Sulfurisphaera tokodaii TaxID=111955 RepID=Q973D6_SULTO|nr:C2H2-type zinc finger protein [Sulfurisphaera tokodaii]BAB65977.1 hypothetical protein STK_09580 [Sulfurisphaera tokodaii str. 7]HII73936.1 hypothetical protein [Sulfurisphaera tokodaii]
MKSKDNHGLALQSKESQVDALDFLRKAIETIDFQQNDLLLYFSLVQVYKWVCPVCLTPFRSYISFIKHLRYEEHSKVCRYCGKEFAKSDDLIQHIVRKHLIHGVYGF